MAKLNMSQINSSLFSHNAKDKVLSAEMSDIFLRDFERMYDDACDVGLAIRNPKTGNVTRWYVNETHRDEDRDITHWTLLPEVEAGHRIYTPALASYKMIIWND
jgi:hypothetical protein